MATNLLAVTSLTELAKVAEHLAERLTTPMMIGLVGPMGSGKTTFVRALGQALNTSDWVNSPTYSMIQRYQSPAANMVHIDLYRLRDEYDIDQLDIPSQMDESTVALIEWVDKTQLLRVDITLSFRIVTESSREITVSWETELGQRLGMWLLKASA